MSRRVIGVAIEVHRILGPGYLESVYEEALAIELGARGIPFERQHGFTITYKGTVVGSGRLDFLVVGSLVVELKTAERVLEIHRAQVISHLKATRTPLGLILNFKAPVLREGIERVVYSV
ncbi:MAG: GxxExxY protein [Pseudomonadota bacterium]